MEWWLDNQPHHVALIIIIITTNMAPPKEPFTILVRILVFCFYAIVHFRQAFYGARTLRKHNPGCKLSGPILITCPPFRPICQRLDQWAVIVFSQDVFRNCGVACVTSLHACWRCHYLAFYIGNQLMEEWNASLTYDRGMYLVATESPPLGCVCLNY